MLSRLDHIRIGVSDPAQAAIDYAALLGPVASPKPLATNGGIRVELAGVGLILVESPEERCGVQGLAFAGSLPVSRSIPNEGAADEGRKLSLAKTRGIPIELIDAVEPADPGESVDRASAGQERGWRPAADGAERLDHAVVLTSDHAAALRLYGERLGLRLALDRSFPKRGVRLLFFRVGGVTIEIGGPLEPPAVPSSRDGFGGLAWRGQDVLAWRERLLAEGFDVSEPRPGHKAGTRVCTVRNRTAGVPTLLISPDA